MSGRVEMREGESDIEFRRYRPHQRIRESQELQRRVRGLLLLLGFGARGCGGMDDEGRREREVLRRWHKCRSRCDGAGGQDIQQEAQGMVIWRQ